ncbi:EAL domain-containing protein [Actinoplanes teichomyceticus]|uniref:EAL domain-containing protein (Putative c-di-GMP-specific phosphodiesterase class I) n=1 Tax=Actinoplanes teichomyceticus TaxID=1867 RepID=A0A561VIB0_ACTTI|nr:EAL domain-containing protein [Actinoplanes teichomyceticus]TWG11346.1 EAL domain-containing protein (putative c-di-GMP-specific phosphodiesterase class I) [Actinoplanes teichomyceticus]GIF16380.1 hypothetical protein Ate01nite_64120 [Actinoplanes teichomyceticus]
MTQTVEMPPAPVSGTTIGAVLAGRLVQPLFQPIVDLSSRLVVGLEALARGPAGTALQFPDRLFAAATEAGRLGELDLLCSERALEHAITAGQPPPLLFTNAEPAVLDQPLSRRLVEMVRGGLPFRQVVELTERALPAAPGAMLRTAGQTQRWGNGLALDDVGVDPMSLAFLPILEPEVIKLDMGLLRDPDSEHTRAVCAVVRAEAVRTAALVIAEGIETEADLDTARRLGARWGQGWLFGRPGPIDRPHRYDPAGARLLRAPRPDFHLSTGTAFETAAASRAPATVTAGSVAGALTRLRDRVAADSAAVVMLSGRGDEVDGVAGPVRELAGRARSVIAFDDPAPGEFAALVIGAGYGHAVCARTSGVLELVTLDRLPAVAAVGRAILSRMA